MEVVPLASVVPPLDPDADPTTPLGELRAGYLPIWSPDFDWAFPPEVCGSDWALDAIAQPTANINVAALGDPVVAAALSVMRYEFLLSRALGEPDMLEQLCVAVATVGTIRVDALDLLAVYLATGARDFDPPNHPDEVTITAASPTAALAVACVTPGYPRLMTADGEVADSPRAPARLQAYLLSVTQGLEDAVTDISYRVANVTDRPAQDCGELDAWAAGWDRQAEEWVAQGRLWTVVGRTVTVAQLCDAPPPGGPDECPRDWSL